MVERASEPGERPRILVAATAPEIAEVEGWLVSVVGAQGATAVSLNDNVVRRSGAAEWVDTAVATIVVLGEQPGLLDPDSDDPVTVEERAATRAQREGKPVLLLAAHGDRTRSRPRPDEIPDSARVRYEAFRERVLQHGIARSFESQEELEGIVARFLDQLDGVNLEPVPRGQGRHGQESTASSKPGPRPSGPDAALGDAGGREGADRGRHASILPASLGDHPTTEDHLGFRPYVRALAAFLRHEATGTPLTVSVEGPWGSGKTSFMRQLEAVLARHGVTTVWFNPWRHENHEALWAAFALEFLDQVRDQAGPRRRLKSELNLFSRRSPVSATRRRLLQASFLAGSLGLPVAGLMATQGLDVAALVGLGTGVGLQGLSTAGHYLSGTRRLSSELETYMDRPGYEDRASFLRGFQEDFRRMLDAYTLDGERVYVFIDDLDRCSVPKAADLLESLNLMIPEDGRIVFVVGMDRGKVTASLAAKHEDLLPFLSPQTAGHRRGNDRTVDAEQALAFGSNFIQKFVQVPVRVPTPSRRDLARMLEAMSSNGDGPPLRVPDSGPRPPAQSSVFPPEQVLRELRDEPLLFEDLPDDDSDPFDDLELSLDRDSEVIRRVALMVAPTLDHNPRQLKRFVNLLRLQAFIAHAQGLFEQDPATSTAGTLTMEKLGKFVAIALRWPSLVERLRDDPRLLRDLEAIAVDGHPADAERAQDPPIHLLRWEGVRPLISLLRKGVTHGVGGQPADEARYAVGRVDARHLLQISPPLETSTREREREHGIPEEAQGQALH